MKRFVRCVCFFLAVTMILVTPAFAAEIATPRASNYFAYHSTYLEKTSGTQFDVWFDVTAVGGMDELGTSTIEVQRSSDNVNWTTMKTYTKSSYSQMICEDTCAHADYVTYYGTSGYYYRAYVVFYAKKGSGTAEYSMYTSSIKL